ncbi:MAG TPA: glutamate-cysteine ligase family protein [Gemmatimonadaceae bacterium]
MDDGRERILRPRSRPARGAGDLTKLDIDSLRAEVESLFRPRAEPACGPHAVGAELELIPVETVTHRVVPVVAPRDGGSLAVIRRVAAAQGWKEIPAGDDPPSWSISDGWRLSFEPGGQLEISSAPCESASALVDRMLEIVESLRREFDRQSIDLMPVGVDPCNHIRDVPLVLHRERYTRMTDYFDRIHESGVQMMRQSASIQINVEIGPEPLKRWQLLNALTPYLTGMFANSPIYRGVATGDRSYRAHLWRTLDPSRTGLPFDAANPAGAYFDFAMDAGAIMRNGESGWSSFRDWIGEGSPTIDDWRVHLTTLFPEVRPRSWFEVRSVDSIGPEWIVAPIATVCGIAYPQGVSTRAMALLGKPSTELLWLAGEKGLADEHLAETSVLLAEMALEGMDDLGDEFLTPRHRDRVREFFDRYTFRKRAPADDRA